MKLGIQSMTLASLITRNWLATEMRVRINETKVDQYAHEMSQGDAFPPPVVFIDPKTEITRIGDGFHRVLAHKANGAKSIEVELRRGGRLDAILYNIESNRTQRGLPFSSGDKQKSIGTLLRDPEASKWNQNRIAEIIGCTQGYVSTVVKLLGVDRPEFIIDRNGHVRSKQVPKQAEAVAKRRDEIRRRLVNGESQMQISRDLDIGRSTVQRCIEADEKAKKLIRCPHCRGSGFIEAEKCSARAMGNE